MKNVLINTDECLYLYEDFKKQYVSLDEILDKYEAMHTVIKFQEEEIDNLKMQLNNDD